MNPSVAPRAACILDYIAGPESGGNYLAYFGHRDSKTPFPETLGGVLQFQSDLVRVRKLRSSATGRYQFMPATLRSLITLYKLALTTPFTPDFQDVLACALLERRGYSAWASGKISTEQFADNLSMEWASMPYHTGASYYDGDGLNRSIAKRFDFVAMLGDASKLSNHADGKPEPQIVKQDTPDPPPTQPAPTASADDPVANFFAGLGALVSQTFTHVLGESITTPPTTAEQPAADNGSEKAAAPSEIETVLQIAKFFLANASTFATYAAYVPHIVGEIPDIVDKSKALVAGFEELVSDIQGGRFGEVEGDFQALFKAVEDIMNKVGIPLSHLTAVTEKAPTLPTVDGLKVALGKAA